MQITQEEKKYTKLKYPKHQCRISIRDSGEKMGVMINSPRNILRK